MHFIYARHYCRYYFKQISKFFGPLLFVLLLCPLVYELEVQGLKKLRRMWNPSPAKKFSAAYLDLLRDRQVHMIRLKLPGEVMRYQRILASRGSLPSYFDGNVPMLAVSRNARNILERHALNYVDPTYFPTEVRAGLDLPFSRKDLSRYLFIRDLRP